MSVALLENQHTQLGTNKWKIQIDHISCQKDRRYGRRNVTEGLWVGQADCAWFAAQKCIEN